MNKQDPSIYLELEAIAEEYRLTKSQESATKLIDWYKPMIAMYCRIMYEGSFAINFKHQQTMQFVSRFTNDFTFRKHAYEGKFKKGDRRYSPKTISNKTASNSDHISNIYKQFAEYKDFYQIACLTLLTMADRFAPYTNTTKSFNSYISKNFHYWYKKHIFMYVKAFPVKEYPVLVNQDDKIPDPMSENMYEVAERRADLKRQIAESRFYFKKEQPDVRSNDFIDINWIHGNTCAEIFKTLSSFERKLIYILFVENKTCVDAAEELGMHRSTIMKKRDKAIEKIKVAREKEVKLYG